MKNTKSLIIRMSPELHKQIKLIAVKNDKSINEYVVEAIKKIVKVEEGRKNEKQ